MEGKLSDRLQAMVDALPLVEGMRILEIGCGPGAAAREIAKRIRKGYIVGIDRSEKAIRLAITGSQTEIQSGVLDFRQVAIEDFVLKKNEQAFDLVFAVRVGALDGRHPEIREQALNSISKVLRTGGKLFLDGKSVKL